MNSPRLAQTLLAAVALASTPAGRATPPAWWEQADPPVIVPGVPANHHGPANIGQAKHMARTALQVLRGVLPATADAVEADLVGPGKIISTWDAPANQTERDANHAPLLIGQLKAIAHPFYEHLHTASPYWLAAQRLENGTESGGIFPWTDDPGDDNNRGMANTGQLKAVFSLRLTKDSDGDSMPDVWETAYGLDPEDDGSINADNGATGDPDEDGLTNDQELLHGTDPHNWDTDGDGFSDGDEVLVGGDPTVPGDLDDRVDDQPTAPPADVHQLVVVGNGASTEDTEEPVTDQKTVVLPAGSPDYLAIVAIESKEFPEWTRDQSEFNDKAEWSVTVDDEQLLSGEIQVNDLHSSWLEGVAENRSHFGYRPAHFAEIELIEADPTSDTTVELSATVTNIEDGLYPTTVIISLLPVELLTDIDNNGEIGGADSGLARKAFESGATEEDIDRGTEYVFVNNQLSNGLADKEDVFAQGITDDDDAEAIKVTLDAEFGTVRFDHPAIDKFEFYESKECVNLLSFPMDLSVEDLPETIYLRTKDLSAGWNGQVEGDLVLKFKPSDDGEEIDAAKLKLTVVESLGDEKFFHACRDYMHENNSGKYIHDKGFPEHQPNPTTTIRMCCMLEETAFLQTIETSHKPVQHKGVRAAITANPHLDVLVNGNLVFFSNPDFNDWLSQLTGETHGEMTDLCNGRILEVGANSPASRDEAPVISGLNPNLAGPNGRYVAQHTDGKFTFSQGRVPLAGDINHAIGGLHTDYGSDDAKNWPIQMLGYGEADEDGKGVVFTATGLTLAQGKGKGAEFKAAAERSGVPPAAGAGRIKLFFLDFGKTSPALAHSNTSGVLTHIWSGDKHIGEAYYVNTYVGFIARKPRP